MKNILVFVDWYLPGYKAGGPIRSMANMVSSLKNTYRFYIVCGDTDYLEEKPYPDIKSDSWNVLSENELVYYISNKNKSIKTIKRIFKSDTYDIVYINGIYSFYFSIIPLIIAKYSTIGRIIVAPRGMLSLQAYSSKKLKKRVFLFCSKIIGLYKHIELHATSETEKSEILNHKFSKASIRLIPNLPPRIESIISPKTLKEKGALKLISIARISPEKNTLFAMQTLLKYKYTGNLVFDLYGPVYDKPYWKKCLEIISELPENIEVAYKGELNHIHVFDTLQQYDFFFLPTTGENYGHSILEAFIAGCPVIISNKTPWQNLHEKNIGWDLEIDEQFFAKAIQHALDMNGEAYAGLSDAAIKYGKQIAGMKEVQLAYIALFGENVQF